MSTTALGVVGAFLVGFGAGGHGTWWDIGQVAIGAAFFLAGIFAGSWFKHRDRR